MMTVVSVLLQNIVWHDFDVKHAASFFNLFEVCPATLDVFENNQNKLIFRFSIRWNVKKN